MRTYRERLTAPLSWWIGCSAAAMVVGWIVLVATTEAIALVTAVVVLVGLLILLGRFGSVTIVRDESGLRVGEAFLDQAHLGAAEVLNRADYRRRMGVDADARAYLVTRPYLDRGVLVHVDDPSDPTPYWLVSSRYPVAIARAINDFRQESSHGQEEG